LRLLRSGAESLGIRAVLPSDGPPFPESSCVRFPLRHCGRFSGLGVGRQAREPTQIGFFFILFLLGSLRTNLLFFFGITLLCLFVIRVSEMVSGDAVLLLELLAEYLFEGWSPLDLLDRTYSLAPFSADSYLSLVRSLTS